MKELKPLLRDDASAFERQLLSAVQRERPSPQLQARMRSTLGLTGPVAWLGAARAALSTAAAKSAVGVAVVGLVAGGIVATGASDGPGLQGPGLQGSQNVAAEAAPMVAEAAPVLAPTISPSVPAAEDAAEDPGARQLREEILLLDQARSALQRGSRGAALQELDRYRARFPEGILSREAAQLRQQARVKVPARNAR
jgi:hypothetical protein